jgi:hypothetical protein
MGIAAAGLAWLTTLDLNSGYAANVMPPLIVIGLGIGLVMAPAMSVAISGVAAEDAGVASAAVNTMQQVGGSISTALLTTLSTTAATHYLASRNPKDPVVLAQAALHSYAAAYWWAAGFFAAGMLVCGLLYRPGVPRSDADAGPVIHM